MKKSYTLQLIDNEHNKAKKYLELFSSYFENSVTTTTLYETFEHYHHCKPDVIVLSSNSLYDEYEPFLKKIKVNYSTPVIILIEPKEVINIASALNYNFSYSILDKEYKQNILNSLKEARLKVELIDKFLVGYNQKFSTLEKSKAVIENSKIPTLITTGHISALKCNKAFLEYFGVNQKEINDKFDQKSFIDAQELNTIFQSKDIINEKSIKIEGKTYQCKVYILQKFELYLIAFDKVYKENKLIDMNMKKDLEVMLERIDKNFDDYVKLQYNMIELSSQIRSFLTVDTQKSLIDEWLFSNKRLVELLEQEFDSNILEELKINLYRNC